MLFEMIFATLTACADTYLESANAAACTINQSSIKKAADSYCGINNLRMKDLKLMHLAADNGPFGQGGLPQCPINGKYSLKVGGLKNNTFIIECSVHGDRITPEKDRPGICRSTVIQQ